MECFALPTDATFGELVDHEHSRIVDLRENVEPAFFSSLERQLSRISLQEETPDDKLRMIIGAREDESVTYHRLAAPESYPSQSPEAMVWKLVDALFRRRLKEELRTREA